VSERTIDAPAIEREHLDEVQPRLQWAYLAGVLGLGTLSMLVLIALLGS
jgi:hypothetical protein